MKRKKFGYELVLWGCLHIRRNPSSGGVSWSTPIHSTGTGTAPMGDVLVWAGSALGR